MNDIWHTIGLRGTASNEYVVKDLFVPQRFSTSRDDPAERREDGLLYRFSSNQLYSCGFAGVGLGIARGTINDFLNLPANKVSRGASRADAGEQRGAVAVGTVRGALALGARLPAHHVGNGMGACRGDR